LHNIDLFLAHYGYFAVFGLLMLGIVGPLIPDETILVFAGAAVHSGQMQLIPAIAAGFAGSLCGITVSYVLGRTGAIYVLEKFGPFQRHFGKEMPKVQKWFEKYGKWSLFFGYFLAGLRHFTALLAGMSKLPFHEFALFAYPGGFIWVVTFVSIGYFIGQQWETIAPMVSRDILYIVAALAVIGIGVWLYRRSQKRKSRVTSQRS
jgi:membrane protein DedA with SNARE-associated domain